MSIVEEARKFAEEKHAGQIYDGKPFVESHLEGVRKLVEEHTQGDPVCQAVALLHDVVEDTDTTAHEVAKKFGFVIGEAVWYLTDKDGKNRLERQLNTYPYIRNHNIAKVVKLCDRLFNMRAAKGSKFAGMYFKEYNNFKFALYSPDDVANTRLWELLDEAYSELRRAR